MFRADRAFELAINAPYYGWDDASEPYGLVPLVSYVSPPGRFGPGLPGNMPARPMVRSTSSAASLSGLVQYGIGYQPPPPPPEPQTPWMLYAAVAAGAWWFWKKKAAR